MGYTHYWARPRVLPWLRFVDAVADCRRLCNALEIPLGDADGKGWPKFAASEIRYNGHVDSGNLRSIQRTEGLVWPSPTAHGVAAIGEADAVVGAWSAGPQAQARVLGPNGDGSYETFHVEQIRHRRYPEEEAVNGWWNDFCKTNYRPYDLCVQGCLIVLSRHLGIEYFRVDSDGKTDHWNDARDACQHVLGFGIDWGEDKLAPVSATHSVA